VYADNGKTRGGDAGEALFDRFDDEPLVAAVDGTDDENVTVPPGDDELTNGGCGLVPIAIVWLVDDAADEVAELDDEEDEDEEVSVKDADDGDVALVLGFVGCRTKEV